MAAALVRAADPDADANANDGTLPTDVLYEVLLRVPAKALCRLRHVCRSWRSLTSDPAFARAHSSRHPLLVGARTGKKNGIHIVDLWSGAVVRRVGGPGRDLCAGCLSMQADLVCFSRMPEADQLDLILNQSTGAIDLLPDGGKVGFPPTCVLGRIPSTGEYKVLRVAYLLVALVAVEEEFVLENRCEVITLGGADQRWRPVTKPPVTISTELEYIAAVHGVAYFRTMEDASYGVTSDMVPSIASFDMAADEWGPATLHGPLSYDPAHASRYVEELDGLRLARLDGCLVIVHVKHRGCLVDLWFLMDIDSGLWTRRYSYSACAPDCEGHPFFAPSPLIVLDDGKLVVWFAPDLKVYDPRTSTVQDIATLKYYRDIGIHEGSLLACLQESPAPSNRLVIDL